MPPDQRLNISVVGEDPLAAAKPTFANFVGISHVGTEVQFEFIFLDLNHVAQRIERLRAQPPSNEAEVFEGRTVSKVVVPVASFVQLREHLMRMFDKFEIADGHEEETRERKNAGA